MFALAAAEEPIRPPIVSVAVGGRARRATPGSSCLTRPDPATGLGATLCADATQLKIGSSRLRMPRGCAFTIRLQRPASQLVGQLVEAGGKRSHVVRLRRGTGGRRWTARVPSALSRRVVRLRLGARFDKPSPVTGTAVYELAVRVGVRGC